MACLLQSEHAKALKQEQASLAAYKADSEAQLRAANAHLEELQTAARAAQSVDRQSRQAQADLQAANSKLQVLQSHFITMQPSILMGKARTYSSSDQNRVVSVCHLMQNTVY